MSTKAAPQAGGRGRETGARDASTAPLKPSQTTQYKVGLGLGLLGAVLWIGHFVNEISTVFDDSRTTFAEIQERRQRQPLEAFNEEFLNKELAERPEYAPTRAEASVQTLELTLEVARRASPDQGAYTQVLVNGTEPRFGIPGVEGGSKARDEALARIRDKVTRLYRSHGIEPAGVSVEILAKEPGNGAIPADDIDRLINTLYRLGISDVLYDDGQ